MMRFDCPACGQRLKCEPEWVGLILVCPRCEARIQIPDESAWVPADSVEVADPVAAYQDALAALERATQTADAATRALRQAATHLYSWRNFVPGEEDGHPVVRNRTGETIDDWSWVSSDEMRNLITDWHAARDEAFRAWEQVPRERRVGLRPPQ